MISPSFSPHFSKAQDCDHFTSWLTLPSQISSPAYETGSTDMTGNTQNCFWNLMANEYQRLIITFVILDQKLRRAVLYISWKWQTCRLVYMGRLPKCKNVKWKGWIYILLIPQMCIIQYLYWYSNSIWCYDYQSDQDIILYSWRVLSVTLGFQFGQSWKI